MTHREIENGEVIERYVRNRLGAEERRLFQEHFFTCDQCFANVQMTERFDNGVRHAAESGLLSYVASEHEPTLSAAWLRGMKPAFLLAATACLVLAVAVGWLLLVREPRLRQEIMRVRQSREQIEQQKQGEIDELNRQLESGQQFPAPSQQVVTKKETGQQVEEQQQKLASTTRRPGQTSSSEMLAANVPVVVLQATRAVQEINELKLSAGTQRFRLWIELGPSRQFHGFRIDVFSLDGRLIQSVRGLKLNSRNAVSTILPAHEFKTGSYLLKLYSVDQKESTLAGEYKLSIERQ